MIRILVIEDQPQMRANISFILKMESYEVSSAENGRIGLEMIRARKPDLVICDAMMPELDGQGVLLELRADPATATLPFIFLTAKGDKGDVRHGMNLGADDYLTKPVTREDLLAAVRSRIMRQRAHENERQSSDIFQPDFSSPEALLALDLTQREAEVLLWVAQGKTNAMISQLLGISEKTVKKHLGNMFVKLGVENRACATLRALERLGAKGA